MSRPDHDLIESTRATFARLGLHGKTLLVACSGGSDSTALAALCSEIVDPSTTVLLVHVRHFLRGDESEADAEFVAALASRLGFEHATLDARLDDEAVKQGGVEAAARVIRYDSLEAAAHERNADAILTAHTADDQAETVVMRFLTGIGTRRLRGIAERRGLVVRPLLATRHDSLIAYLESRNIPWRRDSSNRDPRFLRNRIRLELMPRLVDLNPRLVEALGATAREARESEALIDLLLEPHRGKAVERTSSSSLITVAEMEPAIVRRLLREEIDRLDPRAGRDVGFRDIERIIEGDRHGTISGRLRYARAAGSIELSLTRAAPAAPPPDTSRAMEVPGVIDVPEAGLRLRIRSEQDHDQPPTDPGRSYQIIEVPSATPTFQVRFRRPGDRFRPLGCGQRSLSDFLIDRGIPASVRDTIPLVVWEEEIVLVTGIEVSESFKISDSDRPRYRIEIEKIDE